MIFSKKLARTLAMLLMVLVSHSLPLLANPLEGGDWATALIGEASAKLALQMERNRLNDLAGQGKKNSYLIELSGSGYKGEWTDERGVGRRVFSGMELDFFDQELVEINNNGKLDENGAAIYFVVINDWKLYLQTELSAPEEIFRLEQFDARTESEMELKQKMERVPVEVVKEVKAEKGKEVYLYLFARISVYDGPDEHRQDVIPKSYIYTSFSESAMRGLLAGVAEMKLLGKFGLVQKNLRTIKDYYSESAHESEKEFLADEIENQRDGKIPTSTGDPNQILVAEVLESLGQDLEKGLSGYGDMPFPEEGGLTSLGLPDHFLKDTEMVEGILNYINKTKASPEHFTELLTAQEGYGAALAKILEGVDTDRPILSQLDQDGSRTAQNMVGNEITRLGILDWFTGLPYRERAARVLKSHLKGHGIYDKVWIDAINKAKVLTVLVLSEDIDFEQEIDLSVVAEDEIFNLLIRTYKVPYWEANTINVEGWEKVVNWLRSQDDKIKRGEGWALGYANFVADVVNAPAGTVHGWLTGKHWRTGDELALWEHALGILDVLPGEVLAKAGITALVVRVGSKVVNLAKISPTGRNFILTAKTAGLRVMVRTTDEIILYGTKGTDQIGRLINGVLQDIYWVYGGEKVLAKLAGVRYVVDNGTVNGGIEIVQKGGKVALQKTINTLDEFWARIPAKFIDDVKIGFPQGQATLKYADGETVFYRRWGGGPTGGKEVGSWLSPIKYEKAGNARRYLALPNANTAENLTAFKIEKGTPYIEGKVASQVDNTSGVFGDYAEGGGQQIYILYEDLDKLIKVE